MAKPKIVHDKKKSEQKKALRLPNAPPMKVFDDKKRYNRREKHKGEIDERT